MKIAPARPPCSRPPSIFQRIHAQDQKDLRQCWRTHPDTFAALHRIFHFTIDACASDANALLPRYWTEADDAFAQDWRDERVFCNPPFRRSRSAMEKAPEGRLAFVISCVTTISNKYFHSNQPSHVFLPHGRWKYLPPLGLKGTSSNPIPTLAMIYGASARELRRLAGLGTILRTETLPA